MGEITDDQKPHDVMTPARATEYRSMGAGAARLAKGRRRGSRWTRPHDQRAASARHRRRDGSGGFTPAASLCGADPAVVALILRRANAAAGARLSPLHDIRVGGRPRHKLRRLSRRFRRADGGGARVRPRPLERLGRERARV